jgi:hypothetical protein
MVSSAVRVTRRSGNLKRRSNIGRARRGDTRRARAHWIKLTQEREVTPYPWVHPDDDDRR